MTSTELVCVTLSGPLLQRSPRGEHVHCCPQQGAFPFPFLVPGVAPVQMVPSSCIFQGYRSRHQHCSCCDQRPEDHPGFSVCNLKAKTLPFIGSPMQITSLQRHLLSACFFFVYFDARPKSLHF